MAFDKIPGNAPLKAILRSALRRKSVLPSLLFCGAEGAGQRETALELAKAFNCLNLEDDACDECASCRAIDAGNHPDVIDVKKLPRSEEEENAEIPEAGNEEDADEAVGPAKIAAMIVVHQMRRAGEYARMKPMMGRKRVFLVDDACKMNETTANASLKMLEEPPEFSQFILITSNPDLLLPTIVSRCQALTFGGVRSEEITAILRERGMDDDRIATVSAIVRGNYQKAVTTEWDEYFEERGEAWDYFRSILTGNEGTEFIRKLAGGRKPARREEMEGLLAFFRGFARDLLFLGESGKSGGLFHPDLEADLRELVASVEPGRALRLLRAVDAAESSLSYNANVRLMTSVLFARMTGS